MSNFNTYENTKLNDGPIPTPGGGGSAGIIAGGNIVLILFTFTFIVLNFILRRLKISKPKINQEPLLSDSNSNNDKDHEKNVSAEHTNEGTRNENSQENKDERKWYETEFTEIEHIQFLVLFWFSNTCLFDVGGKVVLIISFTIYSINTILHIIFEYKSLYQSCRYYMNIANLVLVVTIGMAGIIEAIMMVAR